MCWKQGSLAGRLFQLIVLLAACAPADPTPANPEFNFDTSKMFNQMKSIHQTIRSKRIQDGKPVLGDGTLLTLAAGNQNITAEERKQRQEALHTLLKEKLTAFLKFVEVFRTSGKPGELIYNNESSQYEKRKVHGLPTKLIAET